MNNEPLGKMDEIPDLDTNHLLGLASLDFGRIVRAVSHRTLTQMGQLDAQIDS